MKQNISKSMLLMTVILMDLLAGMEFVEVTRLLLYSAISNKNYCWQYPRVSTAPLPQTDAEFAS